MFEKGLLEMPLWGEHVRTIDGILHALCKRLTKACHAHTWFTDELKGWKSGSSTTKARVCGQGVTRLALDVVNTAIVFVLLNRVTAARLEALRAYRGLRAHLLKSSAAPAMTKKALRKASLFAQCNGRGLFVGADGIHL